MQNILISFIFNRKYLQTTSKCPSPCTDAKLGASADISHRYSPLDFNVTAFMYTFMLSLSGCCGNEIYSTFLHANIIFHPVNLSHQFLCHQLCSFAAVDWLWVRNDKILRCPCTTWLSTMIPVSPHCCQNTSNCSVDAARSCPR